jgi:hypothetical protein
MVTCKSVRERAEPVAPYTRDSSFAAPRPVHVLTQLPFMRAPIRTVASATQEAFRLAKRTPRQPKSAAFLAKQRTIEIPCAAVRLRCQPLRRQSADGRPAAAIARFARPLDIEDFV